jgi:hypothetical protein
MKTKKSLMTSYVEAVRKLVECTTCFTFSIFISSINVYNMRPLKQDFTMFIRKAVMMLLNSVFGK